MTLGKAVQPFCHNEQPLNPFTKEAVHGWQGERDSGRL